MKNYKYIFFDFNGTILDDVDLCCHLLNKLLTEQGKRNLSVDEYKNVFTFPIKEYYKRAGIDFTIESFESLAIKFINEYQPKSLNCNLYYMVKETLIKLKEKGYSLIVLSASEINNLTMQLKHFKIFDLFDDVLGLDNIHAASKVAIGYSFINNKNINKQEVLMIGDTLHDLDVAREIGIDCVLVSCGHQSIDVLKKGSNAIISGVYDILNFLED